MKKSEVDVLFRRCFFSYSRLKWSKECGNFDIYLHSKFFGSYEAYFSLIWTYDLVKEWNAYKDSHYFDFVHCCICEKEVYIDNEDA